MNRSLRHLEVSIALPLLLTSLACGPTAGDSGPGAGADGGTGAIDGGSGNDGALYPDASCGAQVAEIPLVELNDPPDLLIVLDKSGSMAAPPGFPLPFTPTKWDIMEDALESITSSYQSNIRFGLSAFPNDSDICGINVGADVSVDIDNASAINSWMNGHDPGGNTPAHLALEEAANIYAGMPSNAAGQYVLFATDGAPNCGGSPVVSDQGSSSETVTAVSALASQGVNTFVLGFGDILGLDPGVLNDAAQAGGEAKPGGPPYYYEADDAASLEAALMSIAGGIILPTCSFEVTETPPDPDLVTVTIDGTPVPRDPGHNNGWDYHPDASTITFFGSSCDLVQGGNTSVSFVFGCPGPTVE